MLVCPFHNREGCDLQIRRNDREISAFNAPVGSGFVQDLWLVPNVVPQSSPDILSHGVGGSCGPGWPGFPHS